MCQSPLPIRALMTGMLLALAAVSCAAQQPQSSRGRTPAGASDAEIETQVLAQTGLDARTLARAKFEKGLRNIGELGQVRANRIKAEMRWQQVLAAGRSRS